MSASLSKIIDLINSKSYLKAELEIDRLIAQSPNDFNLNKMLGVCLMSRLKFYKAIDAFQKCISVNKNDYDVLVNLSFSYLKTQDYKNSLYFSNQAILVNESRPESYNNLAENYFFLNDLDKAEENILLSSERRGGFQSKEILFFIDTIVLYADILLAKKKHTKFLEFANTFLDKGYHIDELLIRVFRLDPSFIKQTHLDNLKKILKNLNKIKNLVQKNISEANIFFFLAEYLEKENKSQSEKYYIKANQIIASVQRESIYKRQNKFKSIIKIFSSIDANSISEKIDPRKGDGLIFIIGMPRSGTTLMESIIATADNCQAGGEKLFFNLKCNSILSQFPDFDFDFDFFEKLGNDYLEIIEIQRAKKKFFIDKLPENYAYFKFIQLSLPGAKFVHVFRNPWDNAISLFKQNYAINLFYASSFFGIATEYANYENLISFWKENDKNKNIFLDIDYKDLVNNTEQIANKIWEYCGLTGKYNENDRKNHISVTASQQQVTKNIYKSSLEKPDFIDFKEQFYVDLESQRAYWKNLKKLN